MTGYDEHDDKLADLGRLLDAHGGSEARWPVHARDSMRQLLAELPEGARLLDEARAFDRALDTAAQPVVSAGRALSDRIVAAAMSRPSTTSVPHPGARVIGAQVIALPRRPLWSTAAADLGVGRRQIAAALVAACLLIGVVLGGTVRVDPLLQDFADAVGLSDLETTNMALADETFEDDAL